MRLWIFNKFNTIWMEKVVKSLLSRNPFSQISSKFSENSSCLINLLFNARDPKLGHFAFFNKLFSICKGLIVHLGRRYKFSPGLWTAAILSSSVTTTVTTPVSRFSSSSVGSANSTVLQVRKRKMPKSKKYHNHQLWHRKLDKLQYKTKRFLRFTKKIFIYF